MRKKPSGTKKRYSSGRKDRLVNERLIEQPVSDATDAIPCAVCHHPVDPRRMQIHMQRFHGAKFGTKLGATPG